MKYKWSLIISWGLILNIHQDPSTIKGSTLWVKAIKQMIAMKRNTNIKTSMNTTEMKKIKSRVGFGHCLQFVTKITVPRWHKGFIFCKGLFKINMYYSLLFRLDFLYTGSLCIFSQSILSIIFFLIMTHSHWSLPRYFHWNLTAKWRSSALIFPLPSPKQNPNYSRPP